MTERNTTDLIRIIFLSASLVLISFQLQGNIGISLGDEGFLWYGTIQTALGKIPLHDFQSYDPGRYYWCAGWSEIFGAGIISLRLSAAIFQFSGLCFALLTLRRLIRSWLLLALSGLVLLIWMHPRHKFFEPGIAMAAIFFAVCLIENPSLGQHYISGVFVGMAAFFGRNLGLYTFLSFFVLIIFIWHKIKKACLGTRTGLWLGGVVTGYLPMLVMMILIPGFFSSVMDIIFDVIRFGHTNMPVPIPWPWHYDYSQATMMEGLKRLLTGSFYIVLPLFYLVILMNILMSGPDQLKHKTVLIAVLSVGLIFMHYPFSCPDFPHLTQSAHPFLIGLLSVAFVFKYNRILKYGLFAIIIIATFIMVGTEHPFYQKIAGKQGDFVCYDIAGDKLRIKKSAADLIDIVKKINKENVQKHEKLLLVPGWAGMYPILDRESPLWNLYYIIPETEKRQNEIIKELWLKNVNWVISGDVPFGGLDELRFKNTHQVLWWHFADYFEPVPVPGLPGNYKLLRRIKP